MKRQFTIALILMIVSAVTACKKDEGTHVDIVGTWKVSKIETMVAGSDPVVYTGTSSDTFEFRRNEGNEMVVNLNSNSFIGTYNVLLKDAFKLSYGGKQRNGQINTITDTNLEFTVTVEGASPATTEKYYLTK